MRFLRATAWGILVAGIVSTTVYAGGSVTYSIDSGVGDGRGAGCGVQELDNPQATTTEWANHFTATYGGEIITEVQAAFGTSTLDWPYVSQDGLPVQITLYNDVNNDGNPSDLVVLAQTEGVITNYATDVFTTYDIPDTEVNGSFFVSASVQHLDTALVARLDDAEGTDQGWIRATCLPNWIQFSADSTEPTMYVDWMIRASGEPDVHPRSVALSAVIAQRGRASRLFPRTYEVTNTVMATTGGEFCPEPTIGGSETFEEDWAIDADGTFLIDGENSGSYDFISETVSTAGVETYDEFEEGTGIATSYTTTFSWSAAYSSASKSFEGTIQGSSSWTRTNGASGDCTYTMSASACDVSGAGCGP